MKLVSVLVLLTAVTFTLAEQKNFADHMAEYLDKIISAIPIKPQVGSNSGGEILKRIKYLVVKYDYVLTDADMDELHGCYFFKYFRSWHDGSETSKLTNQEAYCKRLIDCTPTPYEATAFKVSHRFEAMSNELMKFTPSKTLYPTENEKLEIENCYFFRSFYKEPTRLSNSEAFCNRLVRDILNKTEILNASSFYPFEPYHDVWLTFSGEARQDYAQILECFPHERTFQEESRESWTGPCTQYYEKLRKPTTVRDIRRVEVHDCMRPGNQVGERKDDCQATIRTYKEKYCDPNGYLN